MRYERKNAVLILVIVFTLLAMNFNFGDLQEFSASAFSKNTRIGFGVGNLTFMTPSNGSEAPLPIEDFNPEVQFKESSSYDSIETKIKPSNNFPMLIAMVLLLFTYCAALYFNRDIKTSEIRNMRINHQI